MMGTFLSQPLVELKFAKNERLHKRDLSVKLFVKTRFDANRPEAFVKITFHVRLKLGILMGKKLGKPIDKLS